MDTPSPLIDQYSAAKTWFKAQKALSLKAQQALSSAIATEDLPAVRRALSEGASLHDQDHGVPLWFYGAQRIKAPGMLQLLLDTGLDPNIAHPPSIHRNQGVTFLHAVVGLGTLDDLNLMLAHGGDTHKLDGNNRGILLQAVRNGKTDLIQRTLDLAPEQLNPPSLVTDLMDASLEGIHDDEVVHAFWTPLQAAMATVHDTSAEVVRMLLNAGAHTHVRTRNGHRLADLARINDNGEALTVLEQHMLRTTLAEKGLHQDLQQGLDPGPSEPPRARARPRL